MKDSDNNNKSFWDKFAFLYGAFMKKNDKAYNAICDKIVGYFTPQMNVLELACGTGQISYRLADKVQNWLATDYSDNMIREAVKQNRNVKITFETADATALKYGDESFDVVVIANALHIMPNPDKAMTEIYRVLKKGGLIIAPTFVWEGVKSNFRIWLLNRVGFKFYAKWSVGDFCKYAEQFGFGIVSAEAIPAVPVNECILIGKK